MLAKALDSLLTRSRFWILNNLSPTLARIIRGSRGCVIDLYLKDDIFVFEIIFIVPSRHERVCGAGEIEVEREAEVLDFTQTWR